MPVFLLLVLVWGSSFLLIKLALEGLTPPQIAVVRTMLGAATLLLFMAATRRRFPRDRGLWGHMLVVALTQCTIPFSLTAWVGQYIPSSLSSIFNAAAPTFTVLFTPLLLRKEKLSRLQLVGLLVGIVGVVVLIGPWRLVGLEDLATSIPGQLGMLASAAIFAFGLVYMRRFVSATREDPVTISAMQIVLAAAPLVLLSPLTSLTPVRLDARVIVAMVLLGVLGTGVAYIWGTRIIQSWGATRASTVTYLMPIVGVVAGIVVLHETMNWNEPVGGAIILAGVIAAQLAAPRDTGRAYPEHGELLT